MPISRARTRRGARRKPLSLHTRLCALSPICVVPETAVLAVCAFFEASVLQQARSGLEVCSHARRQPCIQICSAQAAPAPFHSQVRRRKERKDERKEERRRKEESFVCVCRYTWQSHRTSVCLCALSLSWYLSLSRSQRSNRSAVCKCPCMRVYCLTGHTHTHTHTHTHVHTPLNISQIPQSCLA
jgi:hypothetical protein